MSGPIGRPPEWDDLLYAAGLGALPQPFVVTPDGGVRCARACEYAADVGMAEHGTDPERTGGCGHCAHYFQPPSPYDQERVCPIALLNDDPRTWTDPCDRGGCQAYGGTCSAPGTTMGCGGCCHCLGGCQVDWERREGAPYVWEGDQA